MVSLISLYLPTNFEFLSNFLSKDFQGIKCFLKDGGHRRPRRLKSVKFEVKISAKWWRSTRCYIFTNNTEVVHLKTFIDGKFDR